MNVHYDSQRDFILINGRELCPYVKSHEYITIAALPQDLDALHIGLAGAFKEIMTIHRPTLLIHLLLGDMVAIVDGYLDRGADLLDVISYQASHMLWFTPFQPHKDSYLYSLVMHEAWNELPAIHKSRDLKRCVHQLLAWGKEAPSYEPPEVRDKARRFVQAALRKKMRTLSDLYLTTATCCGDYIAYAYEMQEVQALIERFS